MLKNNRYRRNLAAAVLFDQRPAQRLRCRGFACDALKQRWGGWRCYIFSADPALAKLIKLKASKRTPLFNGALECRLYEYRMVAGSNRPKERGDAEGAPG